MYETCDFKQKNIFIEILIFKKLKVKSDVSLVQTLMIMCKFKVKASEAIFSTNSTAHRLPLPFF